MRYAIATLLLAGSMWAQQPPAAAPGAPAAQPGRGGRGPQGPVVVSPELGDKKITFRIHAPNAQSVKLMGGDIPGNGPGAAMTKDEKGIWEVTLTPPPGAYRYYFNVDGNRTIDPVNPSISESNTKHPKDDVRMNGQIGFPHRWWSKSQAACMSHATPR